MSHSLMQATAKPMRDAMLMAIYEGMATDPDIFFVTADFGSPVLDKLRADYPDRYVNVGIAEQNLINVSAGLALEGYKVFAYAIAPFITMRCYEQIRVNLALLSEIRSMNITLIGIGIGYSYVVSGPTHQCFEDLTIMRVLPNISIFSPADHVSTVAMFSHCLARSGPKYMRLDSQILPVLYEKAPEIEQGFHIHQTGEGICLIATAYMVHTALQVAESLADLGVKVSVIDLFDITHFSQNALRDFLCSHRSVITLEEGFKGRGGLDAMIFNFIIEQQLDLKMLNIGLAPAYHFELGSRSDLHEQVGLGAQSITSKILLMAEETCNIL